jgi:hypothetical protein
MHEFAGRATSGRYPIARFAAAGLVALLVLGCGGGSSATGGSSPAASSGSAGGGGGGSSTEVGEPYDKAIVLAAADTLATVDSYVYEGSIVQTGGSGTRTQTVHGIVRTVPIEARSVSYTAGGDTIVLVFADGKDYADYGTGFVAVGTEAGTRETSDPLSIRTLYGAFGGHADDFVVAGRETTHEVPSVHLVLDPDELADVRELMGTGAEGWIAELWLAEDDGRLIKAVWGGPQAPDPDAFGQPNFTLDVTDMDCECPVTPPS